MKKLSRYKAFCCIFLLAAILCINPISAADWDNNLDYEDDDLTVVITNWFGLGEELGKATLTSHKTVDEIRKVMPGENRVVMTYEFKDWGDLYENGLGKVTFTDLDTGREIDKEYYFATPIYETRNFPTRKEVCSGIGEEEKCYQDIIGYVEKEVIKEWQRFETQNIPKGTQTIALITDVGREDKIDGVWEIAGKKVSRHAVWTAALEEGLILWYDFETNDTSTVINVMRNPDNMNGTISGDGRANFTTDGKVGNGFEFSDGEGSSNIVTSIDNLNITGDSPRSIFFWINNLDNGDGQHIVASWGNNVNGEQVFIGVDRNANQYQYSVRNDDVFLAGWTFEGTWEFLGATFDASGNLTIWHDGVPVGEGAPTTDTGLTQLFLGFNHEGGGTIMNGSIDELGIWNRTLSSSEIVQLYNEGLGLTFGGAPSGAITTTLNSPTDNSGILTNSYQIFNSTLTPVTMNLTNATIFIWDSSFDLINKTTHILTGEIANETTWNITFPIADDYEWNVFGCGENSTGDAICEIAASNNSFSVSSFVENFNTFTNDVFETSSQDFLLNITSKEAGLTLTANLNYNDTLFIATVTKEAIDTFILERTIDIPLVTSDGEEQNKSFLWEITTFDGTSSTQTNSSEQQQNITRIHFENCTSGQTTVSLNFTAYDEQNLTRINPFKFDGTFNFWLGGGTTLRNSTLSTLTSPEVNLCISPNQTMLLDSQIEYDEIDQETNYTTRNYFFQNSTISNNTQDIFLYLLKSVSSTSFILKVQDDNLLPLQDHVIFIERFFPGENVFKVVQIAKTDGNGKTVGFFETETVDYRFVIKFNDEVLLITSTQKIVGESVPFTLTFTIGEDLGTPWKDLEPLDDLNSLLFWNKSTNIVTFTYSDTNSTFELGRLVIEKQNFSSPMNNTICDFDSTQAAATIVCDVGTLTSNQTGTYTARGLITRNGSEVVISIINFVVETFSSVAGLLGVFLAWFLILISSFAFKFNEIAGIIMVNATIIFVNLIGLVSFGMLAVFSVIAVSIIIVVVLEK